MANDSKNSWSLNKISCYLILASGVLGLLAIIFAAIGASALVTVAHVLAAVVSALMIAVVAILAWRFVKEKPFVWKLLYVICTLLVIVGVIFPMF